MDTDGTKLANFLPVRSDPVMKFPIPLSAFVFLSATSAFCQTEFQTVVASFGPNAITTTYAGNGFASSSTVPVGSEWIPAYEGADAGGVDLSNPHIAMGDALGNVYIADKESHSILKVTPDHTIHTFAGTHTYPYTASAPYTINIPISDGPALATSLNLVACNGLCVLPNGVVYIYDAGNHRIRRVGIDGVMSTIVNDPDPLWLPSGRGLWVSQDEQLIYYTQEVADLSQPIPPTSINHPALGGVVKKWTPTGGIQAITAYPLVPTAGSLELINPGSIAVHPITHKLYVCDRAEDAPNANTHSVVYRIDAEAANPTSGFSTKTIVAGLYSATSGVVSDGALATNTYLYQVRGISFMPNGGYFLCTHKGGQVLYVDTDPSGPKIHVFMHGKGSKDVDFYNSTFPLNLPVTGQFCQNQPRAVSVMPDGSLLIVSNDGGRVRKVKSVAVPEIPTVHSVGMTGAPAHFELSWNSTAGRSYIIERSPDLLPGNWQIAGIVTATSELAAFLDTAAPASPKAFYRIAPPR